MSFSPGSAVPLSVDVKEVAFLRNPVPDFALKALSGPQVVMDENLCCRAHSLFPPTLHLVSPLMFPVTVHLKVKVSPGQVGEAAVSCPATSPGDKIQYIHMTSLSWALIVSHTRIHSMR